MIELAGPLVLDCTGLLHNLQPLEPDAYVVSSADEHDSRKRIVVLTDAGKAKFREAEGPWEIAQSRFLDVVDTTVGETLREQLLAIAYEERLERLTD